MGQNQVSFSADKWQKDDEVVTRMGHPVRIYCVDTRSRYPVVGVILKPEEDLACVWTEHGSYVSGRSTHNDLFIKVKENV